MKISRSLQEEEQKEEDNQLTLPPGLADAGLVLTVTSIRRTTLGLTVGGVTGFTFPGVFTLTVNLTSRWPHTTLTAARAVVGTHVHPGRKAGGEQKE